MFTSETISKLWQDRKYDLVLLGIAVLIPFFSVGFYLVSSAGDVQSEEIIFEDSTEPTEKTADITSKVLYVDISGAVSEPDLYELPSGSRLKDVVKKAGGLSLNADISFFQRNFNLARILQDQDKIYIPTVDEVYNGLFENKVPELKQAEVPILENQDDQSGELKVNVNTASIEELDALPGVGQVTAEKIVDNRPYASLDDLITKKALGAATFEKVKELLSI